MAYPLKQNARAQDQRRLPGLHELKGQTLVAEKLREDPGPKCLGARTRSMTLLLTAVGLATFVVPLVETSPAVMGQAWWSPWQILMGIFAGNLPAAVLLTPTGLRDVEWLALVNSLLFGSLFEYAMLAAVLVFALGKARRFLIGAVAALGLLAGLIEMRGYSDIQLAILGGPPASVGGQMVRAMPLGVVLFSVMVLLLVIAAWTELDQL
jgi:hypothetical protein